MFKHLIATSALAALAFTSGQAFAQDEAPAVEESVETANLPKQYAPINYNVNEDRENILVLDLSNGRRVLIR